MRFSVAVDEYLSWKAHSITVDTRAAYEGYKRQIIAGLGDPELGEMPRRLPAWIDREVRKRGRTATVVKRLEAIIKPAIRHVYAQQGLGVPFVFPQVRSDYKAKGIRRHFLQEQEYLQLRAELPEHDTWTGAGPREAEGEVLDSRAPFTVYPRMFVDLGVETGLHSSDLNRFRARYFNRKDGTWWRDNSKNAEHYPPAWMRCTDHLFAILDRHCKTFDLRGDDLLVASEPPPVQWMRRRFYWAARRAGLSWVPSDIDLRHTCAQWRRRQGWTEGETALWLANSSGIVREVYAPVPVAEIDHAVARSQRSSRNLIRMTRDLEAPRRGARGAGRGPRDKSTTRSEPRSKTSNRRELSHGKETL